MPERITISPEVRFGKPCVAGTRISVQEVLELIREGVAIEEIRRDYYPVLSTDDVRACLQYAIDLMEPDRVHLAEMA